MYRLRHIFCFYVFITPVARVIFTNVGFLLGKRA